MCIEPSKLLGSKNLLYKLIFIELKMEGVNQPEVGPFAQFIVEKGTTENPQPTVKHHKEQNFPKMF